MIKVVEAHPNQYSKSSDMKNPNSKFFYSLIEYAKEHKNEYEFMKISTTLIMFKGEFGTYAVKRSSASNRKAEAEILLDGDPMGKLTSLDEFINLLNTGDTK